MGLARRVPAVRRPRRLRPVDRLALEDTRSSAPSSSPATGPRLPSRTCSASRVAALLAAILCRLAPDILYAMFTVFTLTYGLTQLGMERSQVLTATLIGSPSSWRSSPRGMDQRHGQPPSAVRDRRRGRRGLAVRVLPHDRGGSQPLFILGVVVGLAIHSFMYGRRPRSSPSSSARACATRARPWPTRSPACSAALWLP